ncbi:metallophosphoesterase [Nocardia heshunensis]
MLEPRLRTMWLANAASAGAAVAVRAPRPLFANQRPLFTTETRRAQGEVVVASDLEVVTVTDHSAVITWTTRARNRTGRLRPVPADTEVRIAPADGREAPRTWHFEGRRTAYHYAEIRDLEPGRAYRFEAYSDGRRATPGRTLVTRRSGTPESTGIFTTLTPPPGRLLRTLALTNDLHYGEPASGLFAGLFEGVRHGTDEYPDFMLQAVLEDLRVPDRGVDQLVVAGDMTDSGTAEQARGVRERLDEWGTLGRDYFVCRGNHDIRPPEETDHWGEVFHPRERLVEYFVGGLRLIGLDTTRARGAGGTLDPSQLAHLRELLRGEPDRPTLVFGHHPVTRHAAVSNPGGPGFVLDRFSAATLHALYAHAPGVFLHHSGHTHRNRLSRPDSGVGVEFLEVGAVKEYPGGYTLVRVYEGGYMVNFYKTRSEAARRWSTRTRSQYMGLHPDHPLGSLVDRNHVVLRDFSGLRGSIG